MLKIAQSGMKGRKKDTLLMISVILLSMIFIVTAILLHTSNEATKLQTKINTYGKWENAIFDVLPSDAETLKNQDSIQSFSTTTLIGDSPIFGHVGSYSSELDELALFQMIDGKMPTSDDEIALEYNQMMYASKDIHVGDTVTVQIKVPLINMDFNDAARAQTKRLLDSKGITLESTKERLKTEDPDFLDYLIKKEKEGASEMELLMLAYERVLRSNQRNELTYDVIDGIKVELKTSYLYFFFNDSQIDESNQVDEMIENGTVIHEEIVLTKEMVVSGIFETYTTTWDLNGAVMPNSYVTDSMSKRLEAVYVDNGLKDVSSHPLKSNALLTSNLGPHAFLSTFSNQYPSLKANTFTYPNNPYAPDTTMTYGILALIFIGSAASAFQINLTQMRRRSRKLTLLKSIGATNGQVLNLLIWEFVLYLIIAIPLGLMAGFGITLGAIEILRVARDIHLTFSVDVSLLSLGVLFGIVSIFIGMIFPLIRALKTPLTGTMSLPPKRKVLKHKAPSNELYMRGLKRQSYFRISVAHAIYEKKKHLITLGLYTLTITTLLSSLFLAFTAFKPYINQKIAIDKPDFGYALNYGLTQKEILALKDEINALPDVHHTRIYKYGLRAFLYQEGLVDSDVMTYQREQIDPEEKFNLYANDDDVYDNLPEDQQHLVTDAMKVSIYGIAVDDPIYERMVSENPQFDTAKFIAGESVIVLMPAYDRDENFKISYDFRQKALESSPALFQLGERIQLSIRTEALEGETITNKLAFYDLEVAGVIRTFEEKGLYPFSSSLEYPVVITSYEAMNKFYPTSATRLRIDPAYLEVLLDTIYPTKFARTSVFIYAEEDANLDALQLSLQRLGIQYGYKLDHYQLENEILLGKSLKSALNIVVLGLAIAIITLLILYNTSLSKLEQERERIGTLQALGVTKGQFRLFYAGTGALYAFIALTVAHLVNLIILLITGLFDGHFNLVHQLWLYPWPVHLSVCVVFAIIAILTYYLPLEKILEKQPIKNIQNLQD